MIKDKDGDVVYFTTLTRNGIKKHVATYRIYFISGRIYFISGIGDGMGEALANAYLQKHSYMKYMAKFAEMLKKKVEQK